jgi:hypothetical protein
MTIVLVCGGRNYNNIDRVYHTLDYYNKEYNFKQLIHGAARGADSLAGRWAQERGIQITAYPAKWTKYGLAAETIRNTEMLKQGEPNLVIAFPGGTGTRNMITQARLAKITVIEI